jgi:arginyl-tRNA synthetase
MEQKIADIVKKLFETDAAVQITRPEPEFGDYATNVALQLAGKLGKNPREIAEAIADALRSTGEYSEVTVAGPGFINLRVSDDVLKNELKSMLIPGYGRPTLYDGKTVVTEYSDPNPFKVLHAGHLYTSIVGDAMSNLIEQAGGTVHRVNFGGDVGLHVAKTIWAIVRELGGEHPKKLSEIPETERSEWMAARYVEGTRAYEDDEAAKEEIIALNKRVYQLHTDNERSTAFAQLYWTCRDWSYDYFNAFYERIGTTFEKYYPESETAPVGLQTVLEQRDHGVYEESDGAIVFIGEPYGLHTRVFVNRQGLPTYEAKDVGLSIKKWDDYHFDESVIITGNDITEYMKVVLKSIEQFQPELARRTRHVTHGNVKLAGGVKMSSRMGNFLRAVDVLDIAAEENQKVQAEHNEYAVLGAVKYAFLKSRVGPDVIFEPRESVALQGNSGPYLQYAHARAASIRRKLGTGLPVSQEISGEFDQEERRLLVKMVEYPEVVLEATKRLAPHLICTYLYELAQTFNRFYETSRIAGDEREAVRGAILTGYSEILKSGLNVLGIHAPEQM